MRLTLVGTVTAALLLGSVLTPHPARAQLEPPVDPSPPADLPDGASAYRPVTPCRLLDTRLSRSAPLSRETITVQVGGRCGVPAGVTAAVISVTVTGTEWSGNVSIQPKGTAPIETSMLNFVGGATVANTAVAPLAAGGVDVTVNGTAHVVVDVMGAFTPTRSPTAAGRFVPTAQRRLLDTRLTSGRAMGDTGIALPPEVPADASAVAVTITLVDASRRGFVTAYPAGATRPTASITNADELHRTRAVTTIVPVTRIGFVVHRSMEADLVVDLTGWITGSSAAPSTAGLFVAQAPTRVWDSRASFDAVHPGGVVERTVAIPAEGGAIVANLTAVEATRPGFVTAFPAGTAVPNVSNLNPRWRAAVANLSIVGVSDRGVAFTSNVGTHVVVDVTGYFLGSRVVATSPPPANQVPILGDEVLVVSDSAFAGIRWHGQLGWLRGASFVTDLESCRRLIGASCRGRDGYSPSNAVDAILRAPAGTDTLVVAAGYNDQSGTFARALDAVMRAARARRIPRVVWITYREDVTYSSPQGASNRTTFRANNATLRIAVASGRYPEIVIADWDGYSDGRASWFASDGLHLTALGARRAAIYIASTLAHLDRRVCPVTGAVEPTPGGWCSDPDRPG